MISLDIRTVVFSFILINIISTLIIIFLRVHYHQRYRGMTSLVYAFLFQMVGYTLILLRGTIPLFISLELGNALSVVGIYVGYLGLEQYTGRKTSKIPNIAFLVILVAVYTWFNYIKPDPPLRFLIISVASLALFAQCAWLMLFGAPKNIRGFTRQTGLVFAGFSALSLLKIAEFIMNGNKPADYFQSGSFEAVIMICFQMLIIFLTLSLAMMYNNNLLRDIRTEEEKFSTTFHTAPNAIALTSYPEGVVIQVNQGFTDISGYHASEVTGKMISELNIWVNIQDRQDIIEEISKSGSLSRKEVQLRKKSGELFTGLFSAKIITVADQKHLISSIYDITERRTLQEVISHERNLLRTLIDNLPDPVTIKDIDGKYLLNNRAHLQILGAERQEEVLGKTAYDYFPEEEAAIYDEDDRLVMKTGKIILDKIEFAEHPETGFPYWHMTSKIPIRDHVGNAVQILTISHDITERKRAEDALKESDEFNRSLLRTIPFGMDVVDETGTILFMGENFRKQFGSDQTGKKCWELYRDDRKQCPACPLISGLDNGLTRIHEVHDVLGGKIFDIYHTGMMFHGKKAMLEVFHDITQRKISEGELIKSKEKAEESDRLKTAFLHNISHEIRTPMNAIVGFSNLLREPGITYEEQQSYTEIISKSSTHLLSIVNDVIEISNVEAGRLFASVGETDIGGLLNDLFCQYKQKAAEKNIELLLQAPDPGRFYRFQTDSTKLMQILSNLLNNSFKFTDEGTITFGYKIMSDSLEFFVSDTGIGIEPSQQSKIFDRFYQVDSTVTRLREGTGIGLSISKAYVELLGGKIWLKSEPQKGSVFHFTIPFPEKVLSES